MIPDPDAVLPGLDIDELLVALLEKMFDPLEENILGLGQALYPGAAQGGPAKEEILVVELGHKIKRCRPVLRLRPFDFAQGYGGQV